MLTPVDEATSRFLEAAAIDLERYLPRNGLVDRLMVTSEANKVALVARIRVGGQTFELDGVGDSLITAHTALRSRMPEARLAAAFCDLVDP
jgi:ribosomal protein L16/L10AE